MRDSERGHREALATHQAPMLELFLGDRLIKLTDLIDDLLVVLKDAYAERLRKKFATDEECAPKRGEIARQDSPGRIIRRMKDLDDEER